MREFFKGWRRKVGCAALAMACGLMASWWRSYEFYEEVWHDVDGTSVWLNHRCGRISVALTGTDYPYYCGWKSVAYSELDNYPVWPWHEPVMVYPHWSLVLPFTLLSAYLILWKPRPKEPRNA